MLSTVRSLAALLFAAALLLAGGGLQTTLLALRAQSEGFPAWMVGSLFSCYSLGFMAGCLYLPSTIRAVGHIRVFAALAATTAAAALLYMLLIHPLAWMPLRAINGFCFAGLSMAIESWLNDRADNRSRGRLLSIYRIVDLSSVTAGQLLLLVGNPAHHTLFAVISILVSMAVVPVALTRASAPAPVAQIKLDFGGLYSVSPLAVATTIGCGLANGAYWALAPVFARDKGLSPHNVAWFMCSAIVAGAVAQYPVGWLSDRFDRRSVLIAITMAASLASLGLAHTGAGATLWLFGAAALYGCTAMPMYGLAIAHANDAAVRGEFVRVSSGLLLGYSVGAVVGPLIAGAAITQFGPSALFIHTGIIQALLAVFGLYRMTQRRSRPAAEQSVFVGVPETSPEVFRLDPRAEEITPPA